MEIIVDSGCDIVAEDAEKMGIHVLPLKVIFGDEEYLDGHDLTHKQFYEKLIETDELPTTSQISPGEYLDAFNRSSSDEIICITLSAKLSGCYQSANIAADDTDKTVYLVDSESVAIGQRILTEMAVRLRDQGMSAKDIVDTLESEKKGLKIIALLDTLEYLKKGGRISGAAAAAGTILAIKPVVSMEDGEVVVLGKARGSKMGNNRLIEIVKSSGGIDFDKPLCLAYSGLSRIMLDKYIQDSRELYPMEPEKLPVSTIGSAIGTHIGPGAVALAFFCKK